MRRLFFCFVKDVCGSLKSQVVRDATSCRLVNGHVLKERSAFVTSVNVYESTLRRNLQDSSSYP